MNKVKKEYRLTEKGEEVYKKVKNELGYGNGDRILAWIEERLSKIKSRQKELSEKDWLYKTEDREAGELTAKRRLLEELKEFIEGEK